MADSDKGSFLNDFYRFLRLKPKERVQLPQAVIEIRWKEWLNPEFCCRKCTISAVKVRPYVPRTSARDEDDVLENGAYVIEALGCETTCPKFADWRKLHPVD
jgi:hypothetical protein